jgi:hypothetical protein
MDPLEKKRLLQAIGYCEGHIPRKIRNKDCSVNEEGTHAMSELQAAINELKKLVM